MKNLTIKEMFIKDIVISERPTVLINNGRQTVIRGCNHTIKCTISGKPPPSIIAWIKGSNGDETFIDDLVSEKYSGGTINCPSLTIKDFDKSNEGTYICQATNDVGNGRSEGIFISCIGQLILLMKKKSKRDDFSFQIELFFSM